MTIIEMLKAHVEQGLAASGPGDALDSLLDASEQQNGQKIPPETRTAIRTHATEYVEGAVWMLGQVDIVTTQMGLSATVAPILQTAANYFLNPHDSIPDHTGLYGLLDDAYLAVRFMVRLSEIYQQAAGVPLYDTAIDRLTPTVRQLLGETLATQLDQFVEAAIAEAIANAQISGMRPVSYQDHAGWDRYFRRNEAINAEAEMMAITGGSF